MDRFLNELLKNIRKYDMLKAGDEVVVGFSGGADSVCLLYCLNELRRVLKLGSLTAVHINHGLRGEEGDRDEIFSRSFCEERGISFVSKKEDVSLLARTGGLSTEEAGRKLRYEAFKEVLGGAKGRGIVATAHHADDSAETILLNLSRGTGLKGAAGISPVRGGEPRIVRPLISFSKAEILRYVEDKGLSYVTDSTNLENEYTRNVIRNEILPLLSKEVNERVSPHLISFGLLCREADDLLSEIAEDHLEHSARIEEGILRLDKRKLKEKPRIVRRYVIMKGISKLGVSLKDLTERHFESVDKALFAGNGHSVDLPAGLRVSDTRNETYIYITKED